MIEHDACVDMPLFLLLQMVHLIAPCTKRLKQRGMNWIFKM